MGFRQLRASPACTSTGRRPVPRSLRAGTSRFAPRDRYGAQLPLLRTGLYPSRCRRAQSARWLRPFAAYWDFATGVLAILALLTVRIRPLFWLFVVAFNLVGMVDLILDYYHAVQVGLPAVSGQLGAMY